jgi:glycosyltransferase involved in cell wall biosynthesis
VTEAHRPRIDPVPPGEDRPRWSVMIPAYECAAYLPAAIEGVLAQDPGPDEMQIEVVDDCSSDDPAAVVRRYDGRVAFHRQDRNLGHCGNLNSCLLRSRGELVHVLHGDDAVRPGFYDRMEAAFGDESVGSAFCRYIAMDEGGRWTTIAPLEAAEDGVIEDWLERIARWQRVQTPAMAVRRTIYEALGGFDDRAGDAEDWEMWTRIAAHTRVFHVVEPLALYRVRSSSLSGGTLRTGSNVENLRRVVELNRESLPLDRRDALTAEAFEVIALTALKRARRLLGAGERDAARSQAREALRTSRSAAVLERRAELAAIAVRRSIIRVLRRR